MHSDDYPIADLPTPDPDYSPAETVGIQLAALRTNDDPYADAGIRTAYNFASPANRAATGPIDRFTAMVKGPQYRPMIDYVEAVRGPLERDGNTAHQTVTLTGTSGETCTYTFRVSLQSRGPFRGCWQTDRVLRE